MDGEHDSTLESVDQPEDALIETESAPVVTGPEPSVEAAEENSVPDAVGKSEEQSGEGEDDSNDDKKEWYVLKVASNREKSVRLSILRRIKREGLEEYFGEIVIPTEKIAETKGGKKRVSEVKLFPGYMMIHMNLNDDTWYLVRDTNGVGYFTGAAGKPIAMRDDEIAKMLRQEEQQDEKEVRHKIDMTVGETVKITEGPFESFEGTVEAIDEEHGRITVLVEIFGQSTPVELEHGQMEKV